MYVILYGEILLCHCLAEQLNAPGYGFYNTFIIYPTRFQQQGKYILGEKPEK